MIIDALLQTGKEKVLDLTDQIKDKFAEAKAPTETQEESQAPIVEVAEEDVIVKEDEDLVVKDDIEIDL